MLIDMNKTASMQSVDKVLDVLEAFIKQKDGLNISVLSKLTGINSSTVYRICSTLAKRGYLYQKEARGKYFVGLRLLQFNEVTDFAVTIRDIAFPHLKNLSNEVSETAVVTVLNGLEGFDISISFPPQVLIVNVDIYGLSPLHCTSVGKILMANMDNDEIETVIKQGPKAYTENTITNPDRLKRELETVKHEGVAFDDEEYALGVRSVAAPIKLEGGNVIAAVGIVGPSFRMGRRRMRKLVPVVENCALQISRSLGYKSRRNELPK